MINKIYIPTVNRVNSQITYNGLPDELKKDVVMVVQAWERDQYNYNCEYLVLPDTDEFHFSNHFCIANTRLFIYKTAGNTKYAVLDDDITFFRRNRKYMTGVSNMERSSRRSTSEDILEMFTQYSEWLDEPSVTVVGCSHTDNPPAKKLLRNNTSLGSVMWINGSDFSDEIDSWPLNDLCIFEDSNLLLTLLSNGYGNRISEEFSFYNNSVEKKSMKSSIWDNKTYEMVTEAYKCLEDRFPGIFTILYDDNGNRVQGGFRNFGKNKIRWNKSFNKQRHEQIVAPKKKERLGLQ